VGRLRRAVSVCLLTAIDFAPLTLIEAEMRRQLSIGVLLGLLCAHVADGAVLYGLKSAADNGGSAPPTLLFQSDLAGSHLVNLGAVTLNGADIEADALAASTAYGLLGFQQTTAGSRLMQIDPTTAVATLIGPPLFGREIRGATLTGQGDLWAVDVVHDDLVRVSPTTGEEFAHVGLAWQSLPFAPSADSDLAVRADGQMLLVSTHDFYAVDTTTGNLTLLFTDSQTEPGPGSVAPPTLVGAAAGYVGSERIFALDSAGEFTDDLYTYDFGAAFSRAVSVANVLPQLDAGRGDLALLLQPVASGDYNQNGVADAADYTVWRDTLGSTTDLRANGDDDGPSMSRIDAADYLVWKSHFSSMGLAAVSAIQVPEPSGALLMLLGFGALQIGKRRLRMRPV
jgi:hypothetical protein